MAVTVSTSRGAALLAAIYKAIDDKKILTWGYTQQDGVRYLTHTAEQWDKQAWFRPLVDAPGLVFNILPSKGGKVSATAYGIFHGRLIEMLLNHFDKDFSATSASALPAAGDSVA